MMPSLALLAQHLWQSTLVLAAAWLLMAALRPARAQVRYWIWFAASMKFMVPFAALTWIGGQVAARTAAPVTAGDVVVETVLFLGQPLALPALAAANATDQSAHTPSTLVLAALAGVWCVGCAAVLLTWAVRWKRAALIARTPNLSESLRETRLLRTVETAAGLTRPIPLVVSDDAPEPGVFGIIHPILLWPHFLGAQLNDGQIETILAHELSHIRRRDNLTAALHTIVQAVFWFYPPVWWLGERLMWERELACDEAVIDGGSDRRVYAESILKTCQLCLARPLACVAGVGRSKLKERVEVIMTTPLASALPPWTRLLLATAGLAVIALPIAIGIASAPRAQAESHLAAPINGPAFASATIRLNTSGAPTAEGLGFPPGGRFFAKNVSLMNVIQAVHGLDFLARNSVVGGPDWIRSERFDFYARAAGDPLPQTRQAMVRTLIAERFKLVMHVEHRDVRGYALTVPGPDPSGVGLTATSATCPEAGAPAPPPPPPGVSPLASLCGVRGTVELTGEGATMWQLALVLGRRLGARVVDSTGLDGRFDFRLDLASVQLSGAGLTEQTNNRRLAVGNALREQLGLDLSAGIVQVPILVIDSVERPSLDR